MKAGQNELKAEIQTEQTGMETRQDELKTE